MKRFFAWLILSASLIEAKEHQKNDGGTGYTYDARSDFSTAEPGKIPYYLDKARKCLAINAVKVDYRNKFARATTLFTGEEGNYDVTITGLGEIDGECSYRFLANGTVLGTSQNERVEADYGPQEHTFKRVSIPKGATLGVESNAVSNGLIPEGEAFAFARGRWTKLELSLSQPLVRPPAGRLAIVADGNSPDPDDIGATAVMFGLLKGAGLNDRLVHLSHSCDLDPFKNPGRQVIAPAEEKRRQGKLDALSDEGIALFGPFENLTDHFNCRADKKGAVNDLRDAINASSAADPLWIIEAGEPDIIGYALEAASAAKRQFVHLVSHHPANDNSGDFFTWAQILAFGVKEHQVGDQNVGLQTKIKEWDWAEKHREPGIAWIWEQLEYAEKDGVVRFQTNKFDCSDAGMIYWWITGASEGGNKSSTPLEIKELLFSGAAPSKQKNILLFCIDDLRPELACYGVEGIKSPHIDALASEGVLFERAYCQQAICAPSRISMLSGQYPDSTGIDDLWTPLRKVHKDAMSMPRYFKERGFVTASFGKVYHHQRDDKDFWMEHLDRPGLKYASKEVTKSIEHRKKAAQEKGLTPLEVSSASKGPAVENAEVDDDVYQDGAVAVQAMKSLRRNKDRRFFMCVGFAKPHLPFAAPKRYWDLYEREQFEVPARELPEGSPDLAFTQWNELRSYQGLPKEGPLSDELTRELKHGYAACVSYADAQVGRVMAELERLGLRENTIVILWGDHGYKLGDHGLWCKHTNLELDTRVPFIVSAPGFAKEKQSKALVEMVDVFPTLAELTGGEIPSSCDGKSLIPVLKNPKKEFRPFALSQYPRGSTIGYSMRTDRWRYTEWINSKTKEIMMRELFDHAESQLAPRNLAGDSDQKERVVSFSKQLNSRERIETRTVNKK